ncbi:hypothetical protein AeRB84_002192 [Aphanomyces euteiches]|nr:hypothetical protein AeRB84_002192 [Aphanomyces euteiches]
MIEVRSAGLRIDAGTYLESAEAISFPDKITWECLLKPPLMPSTTVWLLTHSRFAVGVWKGHTVIRIAGQVFVTETPCVTENTCKHWSGLIPTIGEVPTLVCDGRFAINLLKVEESLLQLDQEHLTEPHADNVLRIGWSSKPKDPKGYGVHLTVSELRLWRGDLPADLVKSWRAREVSHVHPHCARLISYWRLNSYNQIEPDLVGENCLRYVGFDEIVHPRLIDVNEERLFTIILHQYPQENASVAFALDIRCSEDLDAAKVSSTFHVVLVLDAVQLGSKELSRVSLALIQFAEHLPPHAHIALVTTTEPNSVLLEWRAMDRLGVREVSKRIRQFYSKPMKAINALDKLLEVALNLVAGEMHSTASYDNMWSSAVVVITSQTYEPSQNVLELWSLTKNSTSVRIANLHQASLNEIPQLSWNWCEYSHALHDIEFVLSDVLFKLSHTICHSMTVDLIPRRGVNIEFLPPHDSSKLSWCIGPFATCDSYRLGGSVLWTDRLQSFQIQVRFRVCGNIMRTRGVIALPSYALVQQYAQHISQEARVDSGKCRDEARQVDKLHYSRENFFDDTCEVETNDAQKHFECVRSQKEQFLQSFENLCDDVALNVLQTDVTCLFNEMEQSLPLRRPVTRVINESSHSKTSNENASPIENQHLPKEWKEPLSLVNAKSAIEEADSEWSESIKTIRRIADDIKRNTFFTPEAEVEMHLVLWLTQLRKTQSSRESAGGPLMEHTIGAKTVLLQRMTAKKLNDTSDEIDQIRQLVPALRERMESKKAKDIETMETFIPSLEAEDSAFTDFKLACLQARFTDMLKDKPIPGSMYQYSTFVVCDCNCPSARNALQALLFSLRTQRHPIKVEEALCPPVQSHITPLWVDEEQAEGESDVAWKTCAQVLVITHGKTTLLFLESLDKRLREIRKPVKHIQLEELPLPLDAPFIPPPHNSKRIDLSSFSCKKCATKSPVELIESPCYYCSFFREQQSSWNSLIQEVADCLNHLIVAGTPSPLLWKSEMPSMLFQHRKSQAERHWITQKSRHAEIAQIRTTRISEYRNYLLDRYSQDIKECLHEAASLSVLRTDKYRILESTVTEYELDAIGVKEKLRAINTAVAIVTHQMKVVESDAEARVVEMISRADKLTCLRDNLLEIVRLSQEYIKLQQEWSQLQDQVSVKKSELVLLKRLIELEKTSHKAIDECIHEQLSQIHDIKTRYLKLPEMDAKELFTLSSIQTFSPSISPTNCVAEELARAVLDIQTHEKYCRDRIETGLIHAKDYENTIQYIATVREAKSKFSQTYLVSSQEQEYPTPKDVFADVAFTGQNDIFETWESLGVMLNRLEYEKLIRQERYLASCCIVTFAQTYASFCHEAWQKQCHEVITVASQGLSNVMEKLLQAAGPHHETSRAYRAALEDHSTCLHKLRCWHEQDVRHTTAAAAVREGLLYLRDMHTLQTELGAIARQHNLKETKWLWDNLAHYQSESFDTWFRKASQLELLMERMAEDGVLLQSQVERSTSNVIAKQGEWKAAEWIYRTYCVSALKWQKTLHELVETTVGLEIKRQRAIEVELDIHAGVAELKESDSSQFVDSDLIQSSMLRLEMQKQSRLAIQSFNRVRVLERLRRYEGELLQVCIDESQRKTKVHAAMIQHCHMLETTSIQMAKLVKSGTNPTFDKLSHLLHKFSKLSTQNVHEQVSAFAKDNWLVQHRQKVLRAIDVLREEASIIHEQNKTTQAQLVATHEALLKQVESCQLLSSAHKTLDAVHLMLFLNSRASATLARQVNLKKTALHEAVYMKRAEMIEWFKVDPQCAEYESARVGYIGAECDLIFNRWEIQRVDAEAEASHVRCQQYILRPESRGSIFNPNPELFDIAAITKWTASDSICINRRLEVAKQLRREAMSHDLRELDVEESIFGGDLAFKDVVKIYGRDIEPSSRDKFVRVVQVAKYAKRFVVYKQALDRMKQFYRESKRSLEDIQRLQALIPLTVDRKIPTEPTDVRMSPLLQTLLCWSSSDLEDKARGTLSLLLVNQPLSRSLLPLFPQVIARKALHDEFVRPFIDQEHIAAHCSNLDIVQISPTSVKVTWLRLEGVTPQLNIGHWNGSKNSWQWSSVPLTPNSTRHTLTALTPNMVYLIRLVVHATNQQESLL